MIEPGGRSSGGGVEIGTTSADLGRLVYIDPFFPTKAYATRKTVAMGALGLALLMANASQLMALANIHSDQTYEFVRPMIVLVSISIALQVATGIVLLIVGLADPSTEWAYRRADRLNNASVILTLTITIVNIFISACGFAYVKTEEETGGSGINVTTVHP